MRGGVFGALKTLWQVREMRLAIGLFIANQIAADLFMTIVIFFIKDVMLVPDDLTFVIMGIPLIIAVAAAPLWVVLGEKFGKLRAYIFSAFYFMIPLLAILVAPAGNIPIIIVIAVLAGIGTSATQVLPWSILPDVVEFDEYQNGVRREGMFFGITIFMYKVASAVAVGLATTVLGIFGYVENAAAGAQPHSAVVAVRLLLGFGPAAFMLIAALYARILPLSKERFNEIKRLIEERKTTKEAGQPAV
jgi:Na+/melibiose symporter-like transporter